MKEIRLILYVITLGILTSACEKEQPAPDLPPAASFIMEFDNMWTNPPLPGENDGSRPQSNFIFAASSVYWWNTVLSIQLAVPVAAFLEAFNHEAIWDKSEEAWVWAYTVDHMSDTYTAELFAEAKSDEIHWSMYITKEGAYDDFLWYHGISKNDKTAVSWTINKNPEIISKEDGSEIPFMTISWQSNGNNLFSIKYTGIEEGSVNNGSFIEFGLTDDPELDAYYDIFTVWENNTVNIKWNTTNHNGRVLSMKDYKDPYWHCWDQNFSNAYCE